MEWFMFLLIEMFNWFFTRALCLISCIHEYVVDVCIWHSVFNVKFMWFYSVHGVLNVLQKYCYRYECVHNIHNSFEKSIDEYGIDYVLNEFSYRFLKILKLNLCMTMMVHMILI